MRKVFSTLSAALAAVGATPNLAGKGPGRRRQRRVEGITARQQRLQRQRLPGKPADKINARLYRRYMLMSTPPTRTQSRFIAAYAARAVNCPLTP